MKIGEKVKFYNQNNKELIVEKCRFDTDDGINIGYSAMILTYPNSEGIKTVLMQNVYSKYPKDLLKLFLENKI